MLDALGHLGYVCIAVGLVLLALRIRQGFLARFAGEIIWTGIGLDLGMTSIWAWGFVFCAIDLYGWFSWKEEAA